MRKAIVAALLIGGVITGAPGTAAADPGSDAITQKSARNAAQPSTIWLYNGMYLQGSVATMSTGDRDLRDNQYPGTNTSLYNTVSSVDNPTSYTVRLWNGLNLQGTYLDIPPYTAALTLGSMDNAASSIEYW
ncbi:hypothetical protein [Nonomuraea sp. NPDC023979]|uniref:hypothetical protein n=1 Tax=Nonomuraea sp. NPDC023979 TaxID=3154796 RepID=UPI0033C40295